MTVAADAAGPQSWSLSARAADTGAANNAPEFPSSEDGMRSVAENTPADTDIGLPVAAEDDDNDTLTYSLGGPDAESFGFVTSSGQLRTKAELDYEVKSAYAVTVTASDPSGESAAIDVAVTVTNVREIETLSSPDGRLEVQLEVIDGHLHYSVSHDGAARLDASAVGMAFLEDADDPAGVAVVSTSRRAVDTSWTPVWSRHADAADKYNEITVGLEETASTAHRFDVVFRAYDDGIAFRYRVPSQAGVEDGDDLQESTEFNFAEDWPVHAVGGVESPPLSTTTAGLTESRTPALVLAGSGVLAVHEAALLDYPTMRLKQGEDDERPNLILSDVDGVEFAGSLLTPWRVLMAAPQLGGLLETQLLEALSPPSRVPDASFVQPGKALWDRRIRGLTYGDITYWFNTDTYLHMIDFAADNDVAYLLIDSGWYGDQRSRQSDPLTAVATIDLDRVRAHAESSGVKLILYIRELALTAHGLDEVLGTYSEWGVAGIKMGFLWASTRLNAVVETTAYIEAAARHDLSIIFHDLFPDYSTHPTGLSRTYPNLIAVEYCHAQLDAVKAFGPGDFLETVFVHMLAGPLDMNNGFFGLDGISSRANGGLGYDRQLPELYSTVATEVARILITDTALSVLPDAPEEYAKKDDLFEFVRKMPNAAWDETRVLHAEFGEHVTVARRHGSEWFVGSVIDEGGGTLTIDLGFLDDGTTYAATVYGNTPDSHYQTNREAYEVEQAVVTSQSTLSAAMAPGGGHAVWLRPQSPVDFTSPARFDAAENTTEVGRVRAQESGSQYRISGYSVSGGADQGLFEISEQGVLSFVAAPDYETPADAADANQYVVTVEAAGSLNTEAQTARQKITVTVADAEEAATLTLSSPQPQEGTDLTATLDEPDMIIGVPAWTWERSRSRTGGWSAVAGATGKNHRPDSSDVDHFLRATVTYEDVHGSGKTLAVVSDNTVQAAPVENTPPEFDEGLNATRLAVENSAAQTPVGDPVTATDADVGDILVYSLSGADVDTFTVDSESGQIRVADGAALDHEAQPSHMVTLTATDVSFGADSITVTITIDDVDEAPEAVEDEATTGEDTPTVISVLANDTDPEGGSLTVESHTQPADGTVTLNADATTLTYTPNENYHGTDTFTYRALDGVHTSAEATVAVTVEAVNDAPVFPEGSNERSVGAGSLKGTAVGDPVAADDIDGDALTYALTGADAAFFDLDVDTGQITVKSGTVLDPQVRASYAVTVTATDPEGLIAAVDVTVTVSLQPPSPTHTGGGSDGGGSDGGGSDGGGFDGGGRGDVEPRGEPAGFADVEPGGVHSAAIEALFAAGITKGCSAESLRYCPDSPVTRAQMASFLTRALNLPAPDRPASGT